MIMVHTPVVLYQLRGEINTSRKKDETESKRQRKYFWKNENLLRELTICAKYSMFFKQYSDYGLEIKLQPCVCGSLNNV